MRLNLSGVGLFRRVGKYEMEYSLSTKVVRTIRTILILTYEMQYPWRESGVSRSRKAYTQYN